MELNERVSDRYKIFKGLQAITVFAGLLHCIVHLVMCMCQCVEMIAQIFLFASVLITNVIFLLGHCDVD